ncbi:DUF2642 domain-containing protein [Cohnella lubricantis]|nr:DUF2642 domain-containing protein [Cohnella lubricantis]MBP2119656.1 hypothetical protein [Cohnella lubricantis]
MNQYLNQPVMVQVSGSNVPLKGNLIDTGSDIIVLHNGFKYMYLPLIHIQGLTQCPSNEYDLGDVDDSDLEPIAELSYRKVLLNARGKFLELFVAGNQSIHGYITSIMNDFFLFHSPMYKSLYISMNHLKWLIPYDSGATPYSLEREKFPAVPAASSLARTFEQQLRKMEGEFIVLDLGDYSKKNGLLKSVKDGLIELATADGTSYFLHIDHVKLFHCP